MDLVADEGSALFAGLNVAPKQSYLAAYSSSVDDRAIERLRAAWFNELPRAGLGIGCIVNVPELDLFGKGRELLCQQTVHGKPSLAIFLG